MRAIARDAGPHGVTSNAVLPGWVRTSMADKSARAEAMQRGITLDDVWKERASLYPAGRVVTPGEVAEVIAFLASEESSGVTERPSPLPLAAWFKQTASNITRDGFCGSPSFENSCNTVC